MTSMEEFHLIFVPGPGIGHIVSAIEVGKRILEVNATFSITFLLVNDPVAREYTNSGRFHSHPRLRLLNLPELEEVGRSPNPSSDLQSKSELPAIRLVEHVDRHKPLVREAVSGILATGAGVVGFVVDMFCPSMTDVADELSIPAYVFFTSGAAFLSLMMSMLRLTDENSVDIAGFEGTDEEFSVAGFANPVPARVLPTAMLDGNGGAAVVMSTARRIRKTRGIFVNTFQELEPNIIKSISNSIDDQIPPVYAVGPLINLESKPESGFSDAMEWLDRQPENSVVFLCFGSQGSFSEEQIRHVAAALESGRRRFLWSLRRKGDSSAPIEILPEGFLSRTREFGKVIGWAPQAAALGHVAVGGFVSHCGWNSILESMWFGVPMAAWPLYAEQQLNAFYLVEEIGVAVEVRVDYREDCGMVVEAEAIAAAIEGLMEEGSGVRERAAEMREKSAAAVAGGGSSLEFLASLVSDIMDNYSSGLRSI